MVYKVLVLGVQNQRLKENLKRVARGLDVGQGPNQDKLLCLRLLSFLNCEGNSVAILVGC